MYIRIDASKGINLSHYISKEITLYGTDIETQKKFKITVDVIAQDGAYLTLEETDETHKNPLITNEGPKVKSIKKKKKKKERKMDKFIAEKKFEELKATEIEKRHDELE